MVSRMLQVVRVVHPDERMSGSGGLPLGVEPNQVLRQDGGIWCGLGGAMWSAPQAEQRQFRGQAIPARGGKLVGEGTRSTPQAGLSRARIRPSWRLTGGLAGVGRLAGVEACRRPRSSHHVLQVPARRGRMPLNDWQGARVAQPQVRRA